MRSDADERMTMFGYYADMAAAQFPVAVAEMLVANGYRDPREVMRELSTWCYANRGIVLGVHADEAAP